MLANNLISGIEQSGTVIFYSSFSLVTEQLKKTRSGSKYVVATVRNAALLADQSCATAVYEEDAQIMYFELFTISVCLTIR